jgi:hypothetical protein
MTPDPQEQPMAEPATIDDQEIYDDWQTEEHDQLPPRPRRKLLTPVPIALLGVLVCALGFIGGVLVQKGQQDSSSGSGSLPSNLPDFANAGGGNGGAAGGGAGGGTTVGEVSSVKGKTLYVTDAQGNTVAVRTTSSSNVTRTAESGVRKVKPGDNVVVQGSKRDDGSVRASSITATAAGVQSAFPTSGGSGTGGDGSQGGGVDSLFQP